MIDSFRNILAIPELRKRLAFTFGLLAVYRLGCYIPTPGIDPDALLELMESLRGTVFGFVNTFTGGSLERVAVFALGIMPYITSSIILQLLTVVVPYLEKLSKEGELGRKKITQYTRYLMVAIAVVQSLGIAFFLENSPTPGGAALVPDTGWDFRMMTVLSLTTGCAFVMWLGEQITERGIGNGISLVIFAGIVVGLPRAILTIISQVSSGTLSVLQVVILAVFMVLVIAFIVRMERAQRRIPVQYAKRIVGRRQYGGQSTYLPLRLNTGGVIPVIFASSVVTIPQTIAQMIPIDWMQDRRRRDSMGPTGLLPALRVSDHLLLLLLRFDHLQPGRPGREHAQVWRLHSRHSIGPADRGVHRSYSHPPDRCRGSLPSGGLGASGVPHRRLQGEWHPVYRADSRLDRARLVLAGAGAELLFRRNVAAHRCRRGDGYAPAGREPTGDAQLRRLHEAREDAWASWLRSCGSFFWALPARGRVLRRRCLPTSAECRRSRPETCCAGPVTEGSDLGSRVEGVMASGDLVSDDLMADVVGDRLAQADVDNGFLLDGYPRTASQAETLAGILEAGSQTLDHVVFIDVPEETLVARALSRNRADDKEEVVRERLRVYREKTQPLVEYYRGLGLLREIDGDRRIAEVETSIRLALEGSD